MADSNDKLEVLAVHGLEFEGVLQLGRGSHETTRQFREDCPKGEAMVCLKGDPNECSFLSGFRRNRTEKKYWVLCNCK